MNFINVSSTVVQQQITVSLADRPHISLQSIKKTIRKTQFEPADFPQSLNDFISNQIPTQMGNKNIKS